MLNKMNKKKYTFGLLLLMIIGLSIGYALISSNLNINGTSIINNPTWDIHFENIQVKEGSISPTTPATINAARNTVTYAVTLDTPGDYYEFTVDAKNSGTIDGMIESITSKLNGSVITTLPEYLEYSITYDHGLALANNQLLAANSKETYKVHIGFKKDIEASQLPSTAQNLSFSFTVTYKQADDNAEEVIRTVSFAQDDWPTIVGAIQSGNTPNYHVGDTKVIDMGSLGTHTLRIANTSTPSECSTTGFSQTACGFVLEFADIITTHVMNSSGNNRGGWPACDMRTYVNNDIYNALPSELKNAIIDTFVVSGYGATAEGPNNFTSTDKLYLFTTKEVGYDFSSVDTVISETRILDYYYLNSAQTSRIKQVNGSNANWWLRAPFRTYSRDFLYISTSGGVDSDYTNYTYGVSPAFRIG